MTEDLGVLPERDRCTEVRRPVPAQAKPGGLNFGDPAHPSIIHCLAKLAIIGAPNASASKPRVTEVDFIYLSSSVTICVIVAIAYLLLAARGISREASSAYCAAFGGLGLAWFLAPLIPADNTGSAVAFLVPNFIASLALASLYCGFWLRGGRALNWWLIAALWLLWVVPLLMIVALRLPWALHAPFAVLSILGGILTSLWSVHRKRGIRSAGDLILEVWLGITALITLVSLYIAVDNTQTGPRVIWEYYEDFVPTLFAGIGVFSLLGFTFDAIHRSNELARTDSLTSLPNRRAFDEELAIAVARAQRYQRPLSLIILDLDRFKVLNDQYGHPAGDAVLQMVAQVLREGARRIDTVARIGGEEFAVLLADTTGVAAQLLAERLRRAIVDANIVNVTFTPSLGVASLESAGKNASDLVQAADRALYCAKKAGRNCVRNAEGDLLATRAPEPALTRG